jgi:hypothetical protein
MGVAPADYQFYDQHPVRLDYQPLANNIFLLQ